MKVSPNSPKSDSSGGDVGGTGARSGDASSSAVTAAGVIDCIASKPAKVFRCPFCPALLNERDFDRHIKAWIKKASHCDLAPSKNCPGIRSETHPLLLHFPGGDFSSKVSRLVGDLRSSLHRWERKHMYFFCLRFSAGQANYSCLSTNA